MTAVENEVQTEQTEQANGQAESNGSAPVPITYYASEEEAKAAGSPGEKYKLLKVMLGDEVKSWVYSKYPDVVLIHYAKNHLSPPLKVVSATSRRTSKSLSLDECLAGIAALPSNEEKFAALKKAGFDQLVMQFLNNGNGSARRR